MQFTGGEPLLCDFLVSLLAQARALKIPQCEIFTNGLLLNDEVLASLSPYRPGFAVSLYSNDATVHDRITGVSGSHVRTVAAIRRVLASGLELRVAMVVVEENQRDCVGTARFVRELGVEDFSASRSHAVGRGSFFPVRSPPLTPTFTALVHLRRCEVGERCVCRIGGTFIPASSTAASALATSAPGLWRT